MIRRVSSVCVLGVVVAAVAYGAIAARAYPAEEGLWLANALPDAELRARYGFIPSPEWVSTLQRAAIRINDQGSGAFVSRDGLVITNHHVARDTLQKLSSPDRPLSEEGFLARTREEELRAPDLELNALQEIIDVTEDVERDVRPDMSATVAHEARERRIAAIESAAATSAGLRSEVVVLYGGARYHLYQYRRYTDVRLVFAPEAAVANFGGDIDNFEYPRFAFDVAFFRVYENGRPVRTERFLSWSASGARVGDLVFAVGHPVSTRRLSTVADLELERAALPSRLAYLEGIKGALERYASAGSAEREQAQAILFGTDNALKAFRGHLAGLTSGALMARKREDEARLRAAIAGDPGFAARYGDAWTLLERAHRSFAPYRAEYALVEGSEGLASRLFYFARLLVRISEEESKSDADRLPEFTSARRPALDVELFSPAPVAAGLEIALLAESLDQMRTALGSDHQVVRLALAGQAPRARATELVRGTTLADVDIRRRLSADRAALAVSTDPMIALARAIDPFARAVRRRYTQDVESIDRVAYPLVARAQFELFGWARYPDATSTLRISYGTVSGYEDDRRAVAPFTYIGGLFERADRRRGHPPYRLPDRWRRQRGDLDLSVPLNFVTTNDAVVGSSGSPIVARDGNLVGLLFDVNRHGIVGELAYDGAANRAIAVDARAIRHLLLRLYGATELVCELGGASVDDCRRTSDGI